MFNNRILKLFKIIKMLFDVYFDNMISLIYPSELQLNKAKISDTEAAFLDLHLSILMILFLSKCMINVATLILKLSISHLRRLLVS